MNPTFTNDHPQRNNKTAESENRKSSRDNQRMTSSFDMDKVRETMRKLGTDAIEQTKAHPQIAVGVGVGIGFIAGSIFGTRLGQLACALGAGYVLKHALANGASLDSIQRSIEKLVNSAK